MNKHTYHTHRGTSHVWGIIFIHIIQRLQSSTCKSCRMSPSLPSDQNANSQHRLLPLIHFIFLSSSSPKCSSISILSVRGTFFLLTIAWPRFRISSRTDFRFGYLYKNRNQIPSWRDTMQQKVPF